MKSQFGILVASVLLVFAFSLTTASAQFSGAPTMSASAGINDGGVFALTGNVQVDGGVTLPRDTVVVLECGSGEQARTPVDSQGRFSLMMDQGGTGSRSPFGADAMATLGGWPSCSLRAQASGFQSSVLSLAGEHPSGMFRAGTITMRRTAAAGLGIEEFAVSAASLSAPEKAQKNFAKGEDQVKKGKWAAASDYFRKAIQTYPRYAVAWLELGRAQIRQNNFVDAQRSFQQAADQDSKLLPAYVELARLQATQKQWKELAGTTAKIVELAPESSAMVWFLDSAANYNAQELVRAESSAAHGLRLDSAHKVPQLEYLYGLILASKRNYEGAVQHIQSYIRLAPNGENVTEAQSRLKDWERLATQISTPAR